MLNEFTYAAGKKNSVLCRNDDRMMVWSSVCFDYLLIVSRHDDSDNAKMVLLEMVQILHMQIIGHR